MAYPLNTSAISMYLHPAAKVGENFNTGSDGITLSYLYWSEADIGAPQPTEQEIIDAGNSQGFADWQAEHGGDPTLTLRREAKEALADSKAESALLRAALLALIDEFNMHSLRFNALLDAVDNAVSLATLKAAVALINDLPQRTGQQLRTAAENKLDAGDGDT